MMKIFLLLALVILSACSSKDSGDESTTQGSFSNQEQSPVVDESNFKADPDNRDMEAEKSITEPENAINDSQKEAEKIPNDKKIDIDEASKLNDVPLVVVDTEKKQEEENHGKFVQSKRLFTFKTVIPKHKRVDLDESSVQLVLYAEDGKTIVSAYHTDAKGEISIEPASWPINFTVVEAYMPHNRKTETVYKLQTVLDYEKDEFYFLRSETNLEIPEVFDFTYTAFIEFENLPSTVNFVTYNRGETREKISISDFIEQNEHVYTYQASSFEKQPLLKLCFFEQAFDLSPIKCISQYIEDGGTWFVDYTASSPSLEFVDATALDAQIQVGGVTENDFYDISNLLSWNNVNPTNDPIIQSYIVNPSFEMYTVSMQTDGYEFSANTPNYQHMFHYEELPKELFFEPLDIQVTNYTYDETAGAVEWTAEGEDLTNVSRIHLDLTYRHFAGFELANKRFYWQIMLPPTATSFTLPQLPESVEIHYDLIPDHMLSYEISEMDDKAYYTYLNDAAQQGVFLESGWSRYPLHAHETVRYRFEYFKEEPFFF